MKLKKLMSLLLVGVLSLSILVGCGATEEPAVEEPAATEESQPESEAPVEEEVAAEGVTITNVVDGTEFDVTYNSPQRIVSTAGFTTEMLLALGLEDKIVGYSFMDNEIYPEFKDAFDQLTKLSDEWPSDEVLLAAEPDFITGWSSGFGEERYNQEFCATNNISAYVPKVEGDHASIEQVYEDLTNFGEIFGVQEKASEVITGMQTRIAAVEEAVSGQETVRVFIYDSGEDEPFTLGSGLASDMIAAAGGKNVFEDDFYYWGGVSWESVIDEDPEYIIVMDYFAGGDLQEKIDFLNSYKPLKDVTALKEGNIFVIGLTDVTGGIRNAEAIEIMAKNFHADCFAE